MNRYVYSETMYRTSLSPSMIAALPGIIVLLAILSWGLSLAGKRRASASSFSGSRDRLHISESKAEADVEKSSYRLIKAPRNIDTPYSQDKEWRSSCPHPEHPGVLLGGPPPVINHPGVAFYPGFDKISFTDSYSAPFPG